MTSSFFWKALPHVFWEHTRKKKYKPDRILEGLKGSNMASINWNIDGVWFCFRKGRTFRRENKHEYCEGESVRLKFVRYYYDII